MKGIDQITTKRLYICFAVLSIMPCFLVFSKSVWFDEAYTLALIKHSFNDIFEILKTDMHPPLYLLSLKVFCFVFGYSLFSTKLFSLLGFILTILLGPTLIKATFSNKAAFIYMLTIGAVPMSYYFAVQQRSYSFCILFVTLCFVFAIRVLRHYKLYDVLLFSVFGLLASYNHIYALLTCGVIFAVVNITVLIKNRKQLLKVILSDIIIILGYLPQISVLFSQVKSASSEFWLMGVEPLSVVIFIVGAVLSALVLMTNKKFEPCFSIIVVMAVQVIGLSVTVFVKPLYIARYSVVVLGIFALLVAMVLQNNFKKSICIFLCALNIVCFISSLIIEYDPSLTNFVDRFDKKLHPSDTIVYLDSSFGIVSYYFPENTHICTYRENWFDAFDNVESIAKSKVVNSINEPAWLIKNNRKTLPKYITDNFKVELSDSFRSDFNTFDVYRIDLK